MGKLEGRVGKVGGKGKGKEGCHKFSFTFQIFFAFVHPGLDRQTLIQEYFLDENIFFLMKIFFDDD